MPYSPAENTCIIFECALGWLMLRDCLKRDYLCFVSFKRVALYSYDNSTFLMESSSLKKG